MSYIIWWTSERRYMSSIRWFRYLNMWLVFLFRIPRKLVFRQTKYKFFCPANKMSQLTFYIRHDTTLISFYFTYINSIRRICIVYFLNLSQSIWRLWHLLLTEIPNQLNYWYKESWRLGSSTKWNKSYSVKFDKNW